MVSEEEGERAILEMKKRYTPVIESKDTNGYGIPSEFFDMVSKPSEKNILCLGVSKYYRDQEGALIVCDIILIMRPLFLLCRSYFYKTDEINSYFKSYFMILKYYWFDWWRDINYHYCK